MGDNEALRSPGTHRRWVAQVLYRLPGLTPDGRSVLVLSPLELLQRLARLVPPPRMHRRITEFWPPMPGSVARPLAGIWTDDGRAVIRWRVAIPASGAYGG